ncbi:hypothetical protein ACLMJK_005727 [Lecanora helva]
MLDLCTLRGSITLSSNDETVFVSSVIGPYRSNSSFQADVRTLCKKQIKAKEFNSSNIIIIQCDPHQYGWVDPNVPTFCCDITANDFKGDCCAQSTAAFTWSDGVTTAPSTFKNLVLSTSMAAASAATTLTGSTTTAPTPPGFVPTASFQTTTSTPSPHRLLSAADTAGIAVGAVGGILLFTVIAVILLLRQSRKRCCRIRQDRQMGMSGGSKSEYTSTSMSSPTNSRAARTFSWSMNVGRPSIRGSLYNEADGSSHHPQLPPLSEDDKPPVRAEKHELVGDHRYKQELATPINASELAADRRKRYRDGYRDGYRSGRAEEVRTAGRHPSKAKSDGARPSGKKHQSGKTARSLPG